MQTTTLVDGLCFGEGPRWHGQTLWFSEMHAHQVLTVDDRGAIRVMVEVENQPSGLGWLPDGAVPDGICLDSAGGIWTASPSTNECLRQIEGGAVTHRVALDRGAFACMLDGRDGKTLYILTSGASDPEACRRDRSARIETCTAPFPGVGSP